MGAIAATKPVPQLRVLPLRTLSDERLAELASAGHTDAFGTLYERYREALSRYCRSIVRDPEDARDALQNTMLSVLRALQGRGPSGMVRPWMYRIAHNESVTILRRRHPHEELSAETPDRADTERDSLARYRLDALLVDLRALPERQRGALVMRELGGLEYSEIGDALDMSAVSARKHVFEARVALHDIADGRDTDCADIVRRISDGDGRVLRARSVRGHLRGCPSCSAFERGTRNRRATLGLIPVLPFVTAGTVLGAALHGGGGATSGLAAGGSVAGGSIAAGSLAAGSLLGGGSFAAIKGIALAGAIAVAGAGVIVGTGITAHHHHPHHTALAGVQSSQVLPARAVTTAPLHLAKALPAAATGARAPRMPTTARAPGFASAPATPHVQAVTSRPNSSRPSPSAPNTQAPSTAVPVTLPAPTTSTAPTPPPGATSSTGTPPPTAPGTGTASSGGPATATAAPITVASWINAIIASALQTAGANVAAAEAQAQQALAQSGAAPGTAAARSTLQSVIAMILGGHG
jgi:RNA polymerase sigma factor (sigma-70 family)